MKPYIPENKGVFKTNKSYSPEEVLAAGGTSAFAIKKGKDRDSLIKALENLQNLNLLLRRMGRLDGST